MPKKKITKKEKAKKIKIVPIIAVLCDDIRHEDNGKEMLIGIYRGSININHRQAPISKQKPTTPIDNTLPVHPILHLSLWIAFEVHELGESVIELEIDPPGNEKMSIKAGIKIDNPKSFTELNAFQFNKFPIVLSKEGDLKVSFRNVGEEKWKILRIIPIIFPA